MYFWESIDIIFFLTITIYLFIFKIMEKISSYKGGPPHGFMKFLVGRKE